MTMRKGVAVSPGVIVGVAQRVEPIFGVGSGEPVPLPNADAIPKEIESFDLALKSAADELRGVIAKVRHQLGDAEARIFESHLQIVNDVTLVRKVHEQIRTKSITALSALQSVLQEYASTLARIAHDYFRERLADIRDVISRIGSHLSASPYQVAAARVRSDDPVILVAHEILPSHALHLDDPPVGGIVTEVGGGTSHAAILSRSRGIPAVSGVHGVLEDVQNGDIVIVDGREGTVIIRPDAETASAYRKLQREFFLVKDRLVLNRDAPAVTADGVQIELLANVNGPADALLAQEVGAVGVGLFRTEYLFLTHQDVPDEDEQYEHYRQVVEASPHRLVTIRTLDLGGDKTVPYLGQRNEPNPFMGWRSSRLAFEHPKLFEQQIRAILRAGMHGKVRIMFPMITTLEELQYVNNLVLQAKTSLTADDIPFCEDVQSGVMIEVPAAAVCIDALVRETDFISIGSNDLVQYLMAADRDNPKVAHLCEPLSPAVLRVLQSVFQTCQRTGIPVTLCGEMAGQPRSVLVLYGLGLRRFSMSPAFIPTIKALLNLVTTAQAERFAHHVLQLKSTGEIRSYLTARLKEISNDLTMFDFA